MITTDPGPDPRPQFAAAVDQVDRQLELLQPSDLPRPTPCADYDVGTLLAHLVAVLRKLAVVTAGGDMTGVADPAEDLGDQPIPAFRSARSELDAHWTSATGLDADYTLAWGSMTGRDMLEAYSHEFTVHAWDLARAVGRVDDLDPALPESALDWFSANLSAQDRSEGGPFAPAKPVEADADPYTRLAAFLGRST